MTFMERSCRLMPAMVPQAGGRDAAAMRPRCFQRLDDAAEEGYRFFGVGINPSLGPCAPHDDDQMRRRVDIAGLI
jgi:hypothetical protein